MKNWWFCVLLHNPHSPKILKTSIIIGISRSSNWTSWETPGLSSSIKVSIKSLTPVEEDSVEKPLTLILGSKYWLFKISRKLLLKMIDLDYRKGASRLLQFWFPSRGSQSATLHLNGKVQFEFSHLVFCIKIRTFPCVESFFFRFWLLSKLKLFLLYNYRLNFFQKGLKWNFYSRRRGFDLKTIDFDPCIKILIVQNFFKKYVTKNGSSRLSKWCFSLTTGLIFFMSVKIIKRTLDEKKFDSNFSQLVFGIIFRSLPKIQIFFDSCRYSISKFSKTVR